MSASSVPLPIELPVCILCIKSRGRGKQSLKNRVLPESMVHPLEIDLEQSVHLNLRGGWWGRDGQWSIFLSGMLSPLSVSHLSVSVSILHSSLPPFLALSLFVDSLFYLKDCHDCCFGGENLRWIGSCLHVFSSKDFLYFELILLIKLF